MPGRKRSCVSTVDRRTSEKLEESVSPADMLTQVHADNQQLAGELRAVHEVCDQHGGDVATASLIEAWIDETERRAWFLAEVIER